MSEPAITARGLAKSYGDVVALDGIDLEAQEGTVLGLLGPNGAGKTTAVRILATLLQPDTGTRPRRRLRRRRRGAALRSRIGLAGQNAAVDENLTGFENLEMVGRLYHLGKRPVAARARTSCSSASSSRTPATAPPRPTRAACAAGSTSRPRSSPARRCCSSTSRPRASTRAAAARCGTRSRTAWRAARPCC